MEYPIQVADQLQPHFKSLRRLRGLTQTQLGDMLGLGQGRIAQIEAAPGLVSVEQIIRILAALGASLELTIPERPSSIDQPTSSSNRKRAAGKPPSSLKVKPTPRGSFVIRSRKGAW